MDLEHERRLTAVESLAENTCDRQDDLEKRQDKLEKRQDNLEALASSVSVLAAREERVESDVKEIKADVKAIAAKPAKKWESMEEKVLMTILGIVLGFIASSIGLS